MTRSNIMGKLLDKIAGKNRPPQRSVSVPRKLQMSEQRNISDMLSSIRKSVAKRKTSEKRSQTRAQNSHSPRRASRNNRKSNKKCNNKKMRISPLTHNTKLTPVRSRSRCVTCNALYPRTIKKNWTSDSKYAYTEATCIRICILIHIFKYLLFCN